jgi:hypothetical protein
VYLNNKPPLRLNFQKNKCINFVKNSSLFFKKEIAFMKTKLIFDKNLDENLEEKYVLEDCTGRKLI